MIKIFVDSGSSIKQSEKEKLNVEIIPLRFMFDETEYEDGIQLTTEEFYKKMEEGKKSFPKTSLPYLDKMQENVEKYTSQGYDVIFLSISSKISGAYNAYKSTFKNNPKVHVVDTLNAVGGIRILVDVILKHIDKTVDFILKKIDEIIPRIRVLAIPSTLDYLLAGGRLSKKDWLFGSILNIKPLITIEDGKVGVYGKKIGLKSAMKYLVNEYESKVDTDYVTVPSYSYTNENLQTIISMTDEKYKQNFTQQDDICHVIACHWGPGAFGYVFVEK